MSDPAERAILERIAVALEVLAEKRSVKPTLETEVCGRSISDWLQLEQDLFKLRAEVKRLAEESDAD